MFQSTHSLRSATNGRSAWYPPCAVSIHALLAECDRAGRYGHGAHVGFNPRTPCGVRLKDNESPAWAFYVSIHALLAECDGQPPEMRTLTKSFNPRTPCGVRRQPHFRRLRRRMFQSTHSLRSATERATEYRNRFRVSIHALLAECDRPRKSLQVFAPGFNPRTPCGVRQFRQKVQGTRCQFQSTHSLRSATPFNSNPYRNSRFQSTHSLRSATAVDVHSPDFYEVSIHALLAECDEIDSPIFDY